MTDAATPAPQGPSFARLALDYLRNSSLVGRAVMLAVLTLLPVYHRFCDIGIVMLAVPWTVQEFYQRPKWQAFLSAPLLALLYFSWERRIHLDQLAGIRFYIVQFLYYRGDALLVVLLACVLLSAMYSSRSQSLCEA